MLTSQVIDHGINNLMIASIQRVQNMIFGNFLRAVSRSNIVKAIIRLAEIFISTIPILITLTYYPIIFWLLLFPSLITLYYPKKHLKTMPEIFQTFYLQYRLHFVFPFPLLFLTAYR